MKGLSELRREHGWRQVDVADMTGLKLATYANYEKGRIIPPTQAVYKLAKAFGITVEELMGWDDVIKKASGNRPVIRHEHRSNAWTCPHCKSRNLITKSELKKYADYRKKGGDNDMMDVYCHHCMAKSILLMGDDTVYYVKGVEL